MLTSLVHFRKSTRSLSCWSVRLNCGIWRRPGVPVGFRGVSEGVHAFGDGSDVGGGAVEPEQGHAVVFAADPDLPPGGGFLVAGIGTVRVAAEDLAFPNGSVITPDGRTPAQQIADCIELINRLESRTVQILERIHAELKAVSVWIAPFKELDPQQRVVGAGLGNFELA